MNALESYGPLRVGPRALVLEVEPAHRYAAAAGVATSNLRTALSYLRGGCDGKHVAPPLLEALQALNTPRNADRAATDRCPRCGHPSGNWGESCPDCHYPEALTPVLVDLPPLTKTPDGWSLTLATTDWERLLAAIDPHGIAVDLPGHLSQRLCAAQYDREAEATLEFADTAEGRWELALLKDVAGK